MIEKPVLAQTPTAHSPDRSPPDQPDQTSPIATPDEPLDNQDEHHNLAHARLLTDRQRYHEPPIEG